jgi:hypothetical protein
LALLRFDDAIDIVGLSNYLIHTRGRAGAKAPIKQTLLEQIKEDRPLVPGLPLLSGVRVGDLSAEEFNTLLAKSIEEGYNKSMYNSRPSPSIIDG